MISSSKEAADYTPKQEDKSSEGKISKASSSSSTSWSRLKDPRIVRVSRAFGGKDRHSKVFTVRGLRDRRVRLSVPTAIQLYDLQDRLGLNQPSKVVDWLLDVAKNDIDELPPLQVPPGSFSQFHQAMLSANSHGVNNVSQSAEKSQGPVNWNDHLELSTSNYWSNSDGNLRDRMKSKEIAEETEGNNDKESWTKRKQDGDLDQGRNDAFTSSSFFERANQSNSPAGMLNNMNIPIPNPSFLRWDPSNISRSHTEDTISQSTSLSMPSGSQFVVYPHAREFDPKQMFNFQMLSSSTITSQNSPFSNPSLYTINQAMRPFDLSRNPYSGNAPNKDE